MGAYKEEEKNVANDQEAEKIVRSSIACLWSFLVSMVGGFVLVWWEYKYHATNSQLWMVPFGLILFVTPVIAWFAVLVSETCDSKEDREDIKKKKKSHQLNDSTNNV
ncbi:hypothetical protein Tsubulata_010350 [Turnera subulata]|uniref:Uncharacterized protein n=1 Tax=Turnera subulata TaxID=218843 RepID=A0A9Q0F5S4_9ROSI|nr:hypothetical protein Tsubulata_010350 [Turnera subulata]